MSTEELQKRTTVNIQEKGHPGSYKGGCSESQQDV